MSYSYRCYVFVVLCVGFRCNSCAGFVTLDSSGSPSAKSYFLESVRVLNGTIDALYQHGRYGNTDVLVCLAFGQAYVAETVDYLISKLDKAQWHVRSQVAKYAPEGQKRYVTDYGGLEDWKSWMIDEELQDVDDYPLSPPGDNKMSVIGSCIRTVMNGTDMMCMIPDDCFAILTFYPSSQYTLTHQLFLAFIWENGPCRDQLERHFTAKRISKQKYYKWACGVIRRELREIERSDYPTCFQDLFIEQAAFCQIAGIHNFYMLRWFERIASWQGPSGCFSLTVTDAVPCGLHVASGVIYHNSHGDVARVADPRTTKSDGAKSRVKRDEVSIRIGDSVCLLHKSAVGILYFTSVLKFILSP